MSVRNGPQKKEAHLIIHPCLLLAAQVAHLLINGAKDYLLSAGAKVLAELE